MCYNVTSAHTTGADSPLVCITTHRTPFNNFTHPHPFPLVTSNLFSVSMCWFMFCSFILLSLYSTYEWNYTVFISLMDRAYTFIYLCFLFFKHLKKFIYLIYLFLAALGFRCCARAFSSCRERRPLFVAVRGLLIAVASPVAEQGL